MKKETIFKHEINESIQANAAMNCLKNRNKQQQMNEAVPLVAGAIRLLMPLLRPLITKLVKSLVLKAGAKLTGRQVAKMVIKNVSNGKTLMKIGKKVGQTWTELPAELKQEIAKTAINTFKEMRQPKQPQLANQEQEEDTFNAYYSQDEPDYENDHHGIWLIINLMRKNGMLRAQGIEGRDDVDDGHAIDAAYDLIEQKLNDEGMWIGDDDAEAERFVSFFGEEIAQEAMKSALHNQKVNDVEGSREEYYSQDEPDYDDDSHGIRLILNMLMKRGDITKSDIPKVQKQIKSMLDAEGMWIGDDESEAKRFIEMYWDNQEQEELPSMERHDMILALSEYMAESWIDTGDDGDLDDIYYAVADILDETGDYPASTSWEDCKPWCQKHYKEIEARIY